MHAINTAASFVSPSLARQVRLTEVPVAEARFRLTQALGIEGFTVLNETDFSDVLNRSLDERRGPYFIYEACHPTLANEALAVAGDAGLFATTQICVWQEGKDAVVAALPPSRLATALGRHHLDEVAREAEGRLERVFEHMNEPLAATCQMPARKPAPAPISGLTTEELAAVREATQRQLHALMIEAAGTESHPLQHAIAQDIELLESAVRKMAESAPARAKD